MKYMFARYILDSTHKCGAHSHSLAPITSLLMGLEILDIRTTTKIFCAFSFVAHIYYKYKVLATVQSLVVQIATVTILASYYMHLS